MITPLQLGGVGFPQSMANIRKHHHLALSNDLARGTRSFMLLRPSRFRFQVIVSRRMTMVLLMVIPMMVLSMVITFANDWCQT